MMGMNCTLKKIWCLIVCEKCFTVPASSCLSPGLSQGFEVHQTPSELIRKPGDSAELFCMHGETDYRVMLWYQQSAGQRDLSLIGHVNYKTSNVENVFIEDFTLSGDLSGETVINSSLLVLLKDHETSGLYYCAARLARQHTPTTILHKNTTVCGSYQRLFGMKSSTKWSPGHLRLRSRSIF